ncbi:H(+)/Cl(-) exchange transporter ClcA [Tropicimonas sp. IMCC6043]|uniref:H(+)/Cl(-) exchange transporter ClcA n=1 Tax=Tropicimonas sp. IMCC6043 TaxID=2510645 RepID=UPI00101D2775|nr:H(+)/Cl(-) exchange transporter ClcA [Tropicimonas sp. IMCC6043]RYH07793.1 H(+)/Cl(-) exchange transporter ClcA [Tropicimonas sp. IMCC6043]
MTSLARRSASETRAMAALALLSIIVGMAAGLIGAAFRYSLERADAFREMAVVHTSSYPILGPLMMMTGAALAAGLAAWLVRRFSPDAAGSGIPHVEAVLEGSLAPAPARLIPVKFLGGVLAMGSGLALGREGPSVQMGVTAAHIIGGLFRRDTEDRRALIAGGAGAGLATAFNAPGAGAIFVLEELVGRFDPRIGLVALGASAGAITVSRSLLGNSLDFNVTDLASGGVTELVLFLILGLFVGLLSVAHNRGLLATLTLAERIGGPIEFRAAGIGAVVGLLAWITPHLVGGGDGITQKALNGDLLLVALPALFLFRMVLGAASYAAGTPGGLFAPLMVLGAASGLAFGYVVDASVPDLAVRPEAFALVGMGAFFAGSVRAPLTGIVLVIEMTGSSTLLLPLLAGCFGSMLVAETLRQLPIYAALKARAATSKR